MNKTGRPSKLTPQLKAQLLESIASGIPYEASCALVGISYRTFRNWLSQGEADAIAGRDSEFLQFLQDSTRAQAKAEVNLLAPIWKASKTDWRAGAWILERRHPDRWANTARIEQRVQRELEAVLDRLERNLPSEIFAQVLSAIIEEDEAEAA